MAEELGTPRKRVTHRVTLAPDKPLGHWTVGDLRQFVRDCEAQGIPDDTVLTRDRSDFAFSTDTGPFIAERHTSLD